MQTETWTVKEIAAVDSETGKIRIETEGHGRYMSLLWLYVPANDLRDYRIGDKFMVSVTPEVAELTVTQ